MGFLSAIFGDGQGKMVKKFQSAVDKINAFEEEFKHVGDSALKERSFNLRGDVQKGKKSLDEILPKAFALVRESARRTLGQRHYDVQLMGGISIHQGKIAEMKTGEGKTLVATLAAYLNALSGKGVHIVTVNDYLARRDATWMGQIYDFLGLTVGCINHESSFIYDSKFRNNEELDKERDMSGGFKVVHEFLRPATRREAYSADITYGTNNEFGFDYLRDNMVYNVESRVQVKEHNFVIIDEVDSILIDEARTPLIISAPDNDSGALYSTFSQIVPKLKESADYTVDEKLKAVSITEAGIEKVEGLLGISNIYQEGGIRYVHHLEQALKAQVLFKKDRDYVVKDGKVVIVDEFTGRLMPGRRWSEGLHQAVEAKESVTVERESKTLATITFQNYFRLYKKISGMTGTALTSAEEFHKVYGLDVISIPTHKNMIRQDMPDKIFKTEKGKWKAIVDEIKLRVERGQPVLIGTVSIQKNELLSAMLEREGIKHQVLNAKNHEKEAEIIAQAGRSMAVTVATNMAGRGVDIILGGNPPDAQEAESVKNTGGLHVIGTERHEARRIDNQLRGRSGRQGDSGSSQFFISAEDEVARIFGGDRLKSIMERLGVPEDEPIQHNLVSKAIEQAQSKIEGFHFDARKHVLEYDDVMNRHRTAIYNLRNEVLESVDNRSLIKTYLLNTLNNIIDAHKAEMGGDGSDAVKNIEAVLSPASVPDDVKDRIMQGGETAREAAETLADKALMEKESAVGEDKMKFFAKILILKVIDELWVDHLDEMEHLRDSVRLRAYGQRDPLIEYKIEGQKMFDQLVSSIEAEVANFVFKAGIQAEEPQQPQTVYSAERKVGRNDPCPCGSGKKYKRCGLQNTEEHQRLMNAK